MTEVEELWTDAGLHQSCQWLCTDGQQRSGLLVAVWRALQ